ncbi:MAG: DNA-3-methyladenine glycosylase I [Candidatus Sungbacteria bacterium]|nr:DNA-3-methyladenine glycosylase I [Candidatus Sungbacteria bacterium]
MTKRKRCQWAEGEDLFMARYHDTEWGVPLYTDKKIFEFLCLESFQAGLSWRTILHKRKNFEKAFAGFNPATVAKFTKKDFNRLMRDKGIVRNRMKIEAAIHNAKMFLAVKKEFGAFSKYMWGFVKNRTIAHTIRTPKDYRAVNDEAIAWARDLKKRGFKFLGPTTIYAHMQAVGMINDHMLKCFRRCIR